jgi:hypothetical protein
MNDRPRSAGTHRVSAWQLASLLVAAVVALLVVSLAGTTRAATSTYVYDAPAVARVDVHEFAAADVGTAVRSDMREASASPSLEARGTSTTLVSRSVATNTASLADEGFISPSSVRFSQNSVSPNFSAGGSIDDLAAGLRNGSVAPGSVPQIRIFESNGQWMTLDNRRLVAFQQAGVDVPYRLATAEEIAAQAWKVTTTNGGTSITIRGGGGSWPR